MFIELSCPCGKALRVGDDHAGEAVRCPACGALLDVPAPGEALTAQRPPLGPPDEDDEPTDPPERPSEEAPRVEDFAARDLTRPADGMASPVQVGLAALLAGPLAGCLLLAHTYWKLGRRRAAGATLLAAPLLILALVLPGALREEGRLEPSPGLTACVWVGVALLAFGLQSGAYARHRDRGGRPASVRLVVWLSLLGVFLAFGSALGVALLHETFFGEQIVTFPQGDKVRYSSAVTEAEARALGQALQRAGVFGRESPADVRLHRRRGTYEVYVDVLPWEDWDAKKWYDGNLAGRLSREAFGGQRVRIRLFRTYGGTDTVESGP
jgi:hypothetical protein